MVSTDGHHRVPKVGGLVVRGRRVGEDLLKPSTTIIAEPGLAEADEIGNRLSRICENPREAD
jgi:hypothetical protein